MEKSRFQPSGWYNVKGRRGPARHAGLAGLAGRPAWRTGPHSSLQVIPPAWLKSKLFIPIRLEIIKNRLKIMKLSWITVGIIPNNFGKPCYSGNLDGGRFVDHCFFISGELELGKTHFLKLIPDYPHHQESAKGLMG